MCEILDCPYNITGFCVSLFEYKKISWFSFHEVIHNAPTDFKGNIKYTHELCRLGFLPLRIIGGMCRKCGIAVKVSL